MIDLLKEAFHYLSDARGLVEWGGMFLVCAIVFVEKGFFAVSAAPNAEQNIHIVIAVVVFLSILPAISEAIRHREKNCMRRRWTRRALKKLESARMDL